MFKKCTLFIAFIACACMASADEYYEILIGDLYYNLHSGDDGYWDGSKYVAYAEVTSSPAKYSGKVVIPESVKYNGVTYPVEIIGEYSFNECTNLTEVVIPNSVKRIEYYAFYQCPYLVSIEIPNSITYMGNGAFNECTALTSISIPNSVNDLGNYAFQNCYNLKSVKLSNALKYITDGLFYGCYSLSSVDIPNSVTSIGTSAFFGCTVLSSIEIPNSVTMIGSYAFSGCKGLSSVDIPSSVTTIGSNAFYGCSNLQSVLLPTGIATMSDNSFKNCNIQNIYFSGSLAEWCTKKWLSSYVSQSYTLYIGGKKINSSNVVLPNGLESIGYQAFNGCAGVFAVTVPSSVKSIGTGQNIPIWYFSGSTPASLSEGAFTEDVCLIVDDVDAYKAAWPQYESRIFPRSATTKNVNVTAKSTMSALHQTIGEDNLINVIDLTISGTINSYDLMLMRNKMINLRHLDLTNVDILANSYEYYTGYCSHKDSLINYSFRGLISLKLPKSLKYVANAIPECKDLKYLEINGGVVGANMAPSTNLEVVLNKGVSGLLPAAFQKKTGLRKITIHAPLTSIDASSFQGCTGLKEVILPSTLETIGISAFEGTAITEIDIPAAVRTISKRAFAPYNSSYLTDSYYLDNVYAYNGTTIKRRNQRFVTETQLNKVRFASDSKLSSIGQYAFYMCPIDTLLVPDSVKTIDAYAFFGCSRLRRIHFSEKSKLTSIANGVFQQCPSIEALQLPADLQSIGDLAFSIHDINDAPFELLLPVGLSTVGQGAFYGRSQMSDVYFPNTLKSIARDAFRLCASLPSLSFPTSLQTIGDYAFQNCSGLDEIKVPSTLLSVGNYAFDNCSNVTKVYTYTVEPVSINQQTFSCWHNADLYVPTTSYYTYFYNTQWSQFLSLKQFDEEYEYFYINNDYELGGDNGTIDGNPDADLNENSGLIVTGDEEQQMGVITILGDENGAASIIACEDNLVADSLVIRLITKKGKWNYFCFPFDLLLDQFHFAHQYVIREYDGATRAQYGAGGWINMIGDMIHSGLGYIFQGAQTDTLLITIKNPKISCQDYEQVIQAFGSDEAIHANWNFIGNPYPSWYDLDALFTGGFSSPVYIWNGTDYQVYKPGDDEYHFHPYEGFFTQNPGKNDMHIIWGSNGRETKTQADEKRNGGHMPRKAARDARQENEQRKLVNLQLASDSYTDRARVVFNDNASMDYELGLDAVVMDGGSAPVHLWSTNDGRRLSINERPYGNGQVALGYSVAEDGFYTLSATRMDVPVIIYDNELNQEVDLTQGDYVFSTEAGVNETRFSIARIKGKEDEATAIDDIIADPNEVVNVYTILGTKVLENVRRSDINLGAGVYVIENQQGAKTELNIK